MESNTNTAVMTSFTELSINLTKSLSKDTKKKFGIFFTPNDIIEDIFTQIKSQSLEIDFKTVLEPSYGSGQFLEYLKNYSVDAIEFNKEIFDKTKGIYPNVNYINDDYLNTSSDIKYDLIIGNPPYFTVPKSIVTSDYLLFFDGRPNIYILFIIHSLRKLNENGIIAFILPVNFLNCLYYNKLRQYINDHFTILSIKEYPQSKFIETSQNVCLVLIQNKFPVNKNKFIIQRNSHCIFNEKYLEFEELLNGSVTLRSLGFDAKIGKIVWNQHKEKLIETGETPLIYNRNILDCSLKLNFDTVKKQYITIKTEPITCKTLVINRGYGVSNYKFYYSTIDLPSYYVENHLIYLEQSKANISFDEIISSFKDPRTEEFISRYFKNGAINVTELLDILPIYII